MYLNCTVCETPINANYISYCTACETPLFMPSSTSEKVLHTSDFAVTIESKPKSVVEGFIQERKPKLAWGAVKQSKLALAGAVGIFLVALVIVGLRLMPFIFPERFVNKEKEVLHNMMKAQGLLLDYHKKEKAFPDSLEKVLPPGGVVSLVNPVNGSSGPGLAWMDYSNFDPKKITPGILVYQKLPKEEFEISGFGEKGIEISRDGKPLRVSRRTDRSIYKEIK